MKETKRKGITNTKAKGASTSRRKGAAAAAATKQQQQPPLHSNSREEQVPDVLRTMVEPAAVANLRAVMNAHGVRLLGHLGQQMNAHLNSLAVLEGASRTVTFQCSVVVLEVAKLLEALEQVQGAHADVLAQATLLRRLVADFAQHVHNSRAFGIITEDLTVRSRPS